MPSYGKRKRIGAPSAQPTASTISASEFKAKCLALMEDVRARGVEYLVTKRGQPMAKLVPVGAMAPDPFGFLGGTVLEEHDIVSPDYDVWEESDS